MAYAAEQDASKPHVGDAASIARKVIEALEAVEMIYGEFGDSVGIRDHPKVCRDLASPLLIRLQLTIIREAAAGPTEVKGKC